MYVLEKRFSSYTLRIHVLPISIHFNIYPLDNLDILSIMVGGGGGNINVFILRATHLSIFARDIFSNMHLKEQKQHTLLWIIVLIIRQSAPCRVYWSELFHNCVKHCNLLCLQFAIKVGGQLFIMFLPQRVGEAVRKWPFIETDQQTISSKR